ncbi:alpha/beta fold hydrolase [Prochlorococcus marinus]|uniref:Alpha/beta hydrolase fold n=1 Tax=Prochlorococcus marinus (strain MIT 9211) TaxID=93059 RepID=A9BB18_PROM4|nr:alpha/beta hydrolase [Prochlorococcus marinus]ABX09030.1 Alpha/beta hydrolase fold [Prochlorococcus marinus str. MIT 9211]
MYNYEEGFNKTIENLLDPYAKSLARKVEWFYLEGISSDYNQQYPIAITGKGSPVLLIHGFDSCFLEFRRLVSYLESSHKLIIPDLYGFGFCPRPENTQYGINKIIEHLEAVIESIVGDSSIGLIGASMGGGIAIELARKVNSKIDRLLLLSPAGIIGKVKPLPRPLDQLGVCILKNKFVRKQLCIKAFANPTKDVGVQEQQIASIHINVPGWSSSLAAFARSGGVANCGKPVPNQPIKVIWGDKDKILNKEIKESSMKILKCEYEEIPECGHLPHLDVPEVVATNWLKKWK